MLSVLQQRDVPNALSGAMRQLFLRKSSLCSFSPQHTAEGIQHELVLIVLHKHNSR